MTRTARTSRIARPVRTAIYNCLEASLLPPLGMARAAGHVLVRAVEREGGESPVIELRRLPVHIRMARRAHLGTVLLVELPSMNVFVAAGARHGGVREHDVFDPGHSILALMAALARDRAMHTV